MPGLFTTIISNPLKDIRFFILIFFIIRLYGITNPPLEPASIWRQTDGLMMARNFYENNHTILYPTVDVAGEKTGIVGSEFPLLNYLIYLLSLPFGFHDWYGRLINLIFSSIASFFFYKLIKKYFQESAAQYATVVLLVSMWFAYSRITIPDIFGASLCIIALYYAFEYFESGKIHFLIIYFLLGLAGCLAKVSSAALLSVLAIPVFMKIFPFYRKVLLTFFSIILLSIVYYWYFVWVPYLNSTYGFDGHFFMGLPFTEGIKMLIDQWPKTLKKFYDTPLKYTGFIAFIGSVFWMVKNKKWSALIAFLVPFMAFMAVVLKSGDSFFINSYYPIMFVPSMAFAIGYAFSFIPTKKLVAFLLFVISAEGIINQAHVFVVREPNKSLLKLEGVMDQVSKRGDLIAINAAEAPHVPTFMYFAHRRGWNIANEALQQPETLADLKSKGCKYVLILKEPFDITIDLNLEKVYESDYFKVYKL